MKMIITISSSDIPPKDTGCRVFSIQMYSNSGSMSTGISELGGYNANTSSRLYL